MDGRNLIGFKLSGIAQKIMQSFDAATLEILDGVFHVASEAEIDEAMQKATEAFQTYKNTSGKDKANFLNAIADEILALDNTLIERAMLESGLPEGRIKGERGRTVNQLRLFANVLEEGSWVEAFIDRGDATRTPQPKPDIRKMLMPIGPVVVFTASNFPLAFSTAGGDTAAALAAGNPVVIKAHEAHLGTNTLVALAIQKAAQKTGMPNGVFSSLNGTGPELGQHLAQHPLCKAIAFTGSYRAGKALFDTCAKRAVPIPVFAEMGSINPVVLLKEKLANEATGLAQQIAHSITLGVGQFCTNPGLLIAEQGSELDAFKTALSAAIEQIPPGTMLNAKVCENYKTSRKKTLAIASVQLEAETVHTGETTSGSATVASVTAKNFLANPDLMDEVFGPFSLIVSCENAAEMQSVIEGLEGQLTATIMGTTGELSTQEKLISTLQNKVGRLIFNNVPTGVEVCHAMHHGGPFPATTDSRYTSVGTGAIRRFARPIAFQNWPKELLAPALKDENPLGIWRTIDGELTKA